MALVVWQSPGMPDILAEQLGYLGRHYAACPRGGLKCAVCRRWLSIVGLLLLPFNDNRRLPPLNEVSLNVR